MPSGNQLARRAANLGAALALAACGTASETARGKAEASQPKALQVHDVPTVAANEPAQRAPETGVFAPGEADRIATPDSPASVVVVSLGNEPRRILQVDVASRFVQQTRLVESMRQASDPLPPFAFALSIKPEIQHASGREYPGLSAVVTDLAIDVPDVPKDVAETLKMMDGSLIEYSIASNGSVNRFKTTLSPVAYEDLHRVLDAAAGALDLTTPVFPGAPVGLGARWFVEERKRTLGIDTVRYRLFEIVGNDAGGVALSVRIRQYAAGAGILRDKGAETVDQFASTGEGTLHWMNGLFTADRSEVSLSVRANVTTAAGSKALLDVLLTAKTAPP